MSVPAEVKQALQTLYIDKLWQYYQQGYDFHTRPIIDLIVEMDSASLVEFLLETKLPANLIELLFELCATETRGDSALPYLIKAQPEIAKQKAAMLYTSAVHSYSYPVLNVLAEIGADITQAAKKPEYKYRQIDNNSKASRAALEQILTHNEINYFLKNKLPMQYWYYLLDTIVDNNLFQPLKDLMDRGFTFDMLSKEEKTAIETSVAHGREMARLLASYGFPFTRQYSDEIQAAITEGQKIYKERLEDQQKRQELAKIGLNEIVINDVINIINSYL